MATIIDPKEYGYDVSFIEEVREDFKCVLCHLVLRDPIQFMSCGHRFCSPCFKRMKSHADQTNVELLCPVDREVVPMKEVFPDRGISRTIGNLKVRCSNVERGCAWVDDLRELENHDQLCEYRMTGHAIAHHDGHDQILQQILNRVENCETELALKEKEMALLKATIGEMKEDLKAKDVQMDILKSSSHELQQQVESLSKSSTEKDQLIDALSVRVDVLTAEVSSKPVDETIAKNNLDDSVQSEVTQKILACENTISEMAKDLKDLKSFSKDMNVFKKEVQSNEAECVEHIRNIENISFMKDSFRSRYIEFSWLLQNYKAHHDIGDNVYSPIFHTVIDGYCCRFVLQWEGKKKGKIGVYLRVAKPKNQEKPILPFNREYTLILHKNRGGTEEFKVDFETLAENIDDCFALMEGRDESCEGYGFDANAPAHHFVLNDSVLVSCKVYC